MKKKNIYKYSIPEYFIACIINADYTGLTDNEVQDVNNFENMLLAEGKQQNYSSYSYDIIPNPYFSYSNSINNIGNNCFDVNVVYFK
jgi:hypothetical protein